MSNTSHVASGPAAESLRLELESQGVRYALASYVGLHGVCKAKAVPDPTTATLLPWQRELIW